LLTVYRAIVIPFGVIKPEKLLSQQRKTSKTKWTLPITGWVLGNWKMNMLFSLIAENGSPSRSQAIRLSASPDVPLADGRYCFIQLHACCNVSVLVMFLSLIRAAC